MNANFRQYAKRLAAVFLLSVAAAAVASPELDRAVQRYYAGYPGQAIEMIKPLALSGDTDAQLLLGNIFHALSSSGDYANAEDPTAWYRMAAAQGSAEANYSLGAIYDNRWSNSSEPRDAELAQYYYQQAVDLGYTRAEAPLIRLATDTALTRKSNSPVYTNESFSGAGAGETGDGDAATGTNQAIAELNRSASPVSDAMRLMALLREIGYFETSAASETQADGWPDENSIKNFLEGIDSGEQIVTDLLELLNQLSQETQR